MGAVIAHNLTAINANNRNTANVVAQRKVTEKLSSGLKINRAGDNAAGLAISEKLRSQTRGLKQATNNANDGISLIQTAEGGLNETHAILQRIRELSVQSANGTYQDDTDREAMDLEVQALKTEVDRISSSTEYNKIKLLDGSVGGTANTTSQYGANYGVRENTTEIGYYNITSNVSGAEIAFDTDVSGKGGESASFESGASGLKVTVHLEDGKFYSNDDINALIQDAMKAKDLDASAADIKFTADAGGFLANATNTAAVTGVTVGGERSYGSSDLTDLTLKTSLKAVGYGDAIKFTANTYGDTKDTAGTAKTIKITTDAAAGKETVTQTAARNAGTDAEEIELHLATGVDYSEEDIHNLLAKAGYDYEVDIQDSSAPNSNATKAKFDVSGASVSVDTSGNGTGVGKAAIGKVGEGLIFQIGANGTADQRVSLNIKDMSSAGLGISTLNVATRDAANASITKADEAIKSVSLQRASLGALQNRLEYTVNNLTTTNENLTAAESQIRDTDIAESVIENTKYNILSQASQAMLAQANQAPQSALQLLG